MKSENKITMSSILWYFVIFSIAGLIIETMYCYLTTGVLESRKGLIFGPFCPVYGVGATLLIVLLSEFKDSKMKLFIVGGIFGDLIEYTLSYGLEAIYSVRFWDYSYTGTDLNGRICLTYTIFWGVLAVILITIAKPIIDKFINKIQFKHIKKIEIAIVIFLILDIIITIWGLNVYENRAINKYYGIEENNNSIQIVKIIEDKLFNNEYMSKVFPNLRFFNDNNEEIWIRDLTK